MSLNRGCCYCSAITAPVTAAADAAGSRRIAGPSAEALMANRCWLKRRVCAQHVHHAIPVRMLHSRDKLM